METAVLGPQHQQAVLPPPSPSPAKKAPAPSPEPRCAAAARRKTLCDITNLSIRHAPAVEEPNDEPACADGGVAMAQLVKENVDLRRRLEERDKIVELSGAEIQKLRQLLEERDKIIELSGAEIQKLRIANWDLAQANSLNLAELNLGRTRLKTMQHELTLSRAVVKVKTSELEDAKKLMKCRIGRLAGQPGHHLGSNTNKAAHAQTRNGDVVDPEEPASEVTKAASVQKPGNGSRKRALRSKSLAPGSGTKLALPKEATQRRKSMRIPQPSDRKDDLFELEDVQIAIGGCRIDTESASDSERTGQGSAQFLRRSSLGRPLRQAREKVATYKEPSLNVKLRRS